MKTIDLLSVLGKVKPGIAAKNSIESMECFYFTGTDVITYNEIISVQHPFKTDFSMFIKAQDLYNLASKLTEKEIKFQEKNGKLNVSCSTMKANLSAIYNPETEEKINEVSKSLEKSDWKKLPENFQECVKFTIHTASSIDSDGTLTCININGKDCVSSDNSRISHAILKSEMDSMFIKASEINGLLNIEPTHYSVAGSWIHFKNKVNCIFSIRKITGDYPDYLQFFEFDGKEIEFPKEVIEGIDLTSILVDTSIPIIKFKMSKGICILSVKSESGTIIHRSKITYKGEEINFNINPNFLKEMIVHSSTIVIGKDKSRLETENGFSLLTLFSS